MTWDLTFAVGFVAFPVAALAAVAALTAVFGLDALVDRILRTGWAVIRLAEAWQDRATARADRHRRARPGPPGPGRAATSSDVAPPGRHAPGRWE